MGQNEIKLPFQPVQGTEKFIKQTEPKNGYIYFATDTKKIYCGKNGEFISMGGNSGIYYGNRPLTDDEKYGDQSFFSFLPEEIDSDEIPSPDDLILNIPDGGFYRVLAIENGLISTQRLVIAGGGGGNGSGPSNEGSLQVNFITPQYSSTLTGVKYYINFNIIAKDSAGDAINEEGLATWRINGKEYTQKVHNGLNDFRVDEYLDHTIEQNKIILVVNMTTGGSKNSIVSKTWYVKAINLALDWPWTYNKQEYRSGNNLQFKFIPYGNIDCQAHISFDGGFDLNKTYFIEDIPSTKTGREYITTSTISCGGSSEIATNYIPYGVHSCDIWLTAKINGETKSTEPIRREITVIRGGTSTLLTVPFYTTIANQYDTINIPFLVYDPDSDKCNVSFYVNDVRVAGDSYDQELQHWPYTLTEYGPVTLSIRSDNGDAIKNFELVVNKLEMDASEASGAAFSLKATAFSSNEQIKNWSHNNVTLEFSPDFDWKNGGLKFETMDDGSVEKYICVRQGTRMYIKYKLFEHFTTGSAGGKNFKFCFKTANCYDYSADVLKCYDDETIGIKFDAQKATFITPTYPNFATQYCENSYIEVETEIWPTVDDVDVGADGKIYGDRFLMIWVDGVPAGVKPYSKSESLEQLSAKAQIIEIGSDLCDVHVYVAKAYERKLSEAEHLDNFIMDAPSANKMVERYRRNDILDTRGEISYEKLVTANPECRAYLYEMDHMTTSKDDKVDGCTYYELYGDHNTISNPLYKAEDARVYVQGTSSAAYGVAAFNLRTDFTKKGKIYDSEGEELPGWTVSDTAIPIDIACTKVNVASCENANNVVNAEWYNKFQPYHDAHRRKTRDDGKIYRDTMEFKSGVVFIKDNNPETNYYGEENKPDAATYLNANCFLDTPGYASNPYYKMYAIGNMGNDKKNVNVFHDTTNPWALCVEVADNQNPEHWMTTAVNMSQFDLEKPFHEFRYPDGNDKATDIQKQAWLDFVDWMVASNPKGGNAEHILKATVASVNASNYKKNVYYIQNDEGKYIKATGNFDSSKIYYTIKGAAAQEGDTTIEVLFDNYTYKGFNPPGYENAPNPTEVSLKGTTETKYSTTKVVSQPKIGADGQPELNDDGSYIMEDVYSIVPYTHDTFEYRMAKMLSECEDHLVMDSVMFHYLYISRHTMVDNVAKNTFWSTEDGIHWDLTRNYDNDTSDGNDNSGNLSYSYGLEYGDLNSDGKDVFNASPSVWINFIHNLPVGQKALYKSLEGKGAWKASTYLAEFKKHQDIIPERCWIENYFHHYIRPRRLGLDEKTYLDRLEGGRKTHQRNQFETYQEFYLNSKYVAGTPFTDGAAIDLRLNKDPADSWNSENVLSMTFYVDCYATIHLGGQLATSDRLKRGEVFHAPVGRMVGAPNDATCYIYGANMIQTLSGLDKLYPGYAKLTGANKLRVIEFGSKATGYKNERLKSLDIGSNGMLQKVQMWNCGNPAQFGALTLDGAYQLKELYLSGSQVKELTLADGATTEILELNNLTTLTMSNLTDLTNITMDNGAATSLKNMFISNCPEMDTYSYKWAKSDQLNRYYLTDFHWIISGDAAGYQLSEDFELDNNEVVAIKALENLNDENTDPKVGTTTATALTGTLTIDVPCNIDEYVIYKKYVKLYPNLIIEYGNNVGDGRNPAVELVFLKAQGLTEQHYRVLGSGDIAGENALSIATLISADGPSGIAMATPYKEPSLENTYTYTGYWIDADSGRKYYNEVDLNGTEPEAGAISFANIIPTTSMTFYPEYISRVREYMVKFYDWTGNLIPQEKIEYTYVTNPDTGEQTEEKTITYIYEWPVPYGQKYDGPIKNYHYRDSNDLKDAERWAFQGWSKNKYGDVEIKNPEYEDVTNLIVKNTTLLYGHYLKEDCTKVATKEDYFNFISINKDTEYSICIKDEYRDIIKGKITLPSKYDNKFITTVGNDAVSKGGFEDCDQITHVYFLNDNQYTKISNNAFCCCYNLKKINLSNTIVSIGERAFGSKNKGTAENPSITYMNIEIKSLPENLKTIGSFAFYYGGNNITLSELPKNLDSIGIWAFAYCPNLKISDFDVKKISGNAFYNSGKNSDKFNTPDIILTIGKRAEEIVYTPTGYSAAFDGYGGYFKQFHVDITSPFSNIYYNKELKLSAKNFGVNTITTADNESEA